MKTIQTEAQYKKVMSEILALMDNGEKNLSETETDQLRIWL